MEREKGLVQKKPVYDTKSDSVMHSNINRSSCSVVSMLF